MPPLLSDADVADGDLVTYFLPLFKSSCEACSLSSKDAGIIPVVFIILFFVFLTYWERVGDCCRMLFFSSAKKKRGPWPGRTKGL